MDQIVTKIHNWMENIVNNALMPESKLHAFANPIIGCARGDDPLFIFLKEDIGPDFYWTPEDAFKAAFPGKKVLPEELSVIAWILPQTEHTRIAHRKETVMPCKEWSCARHYGEKVNEKLRRYVVNHFLKQNVEACAPVLLPEWSRAISDKHSFASSWSERHAAYSCGLGTFGLSDGLITSVGKAVRIGSVIVNKQFQPTPRDYTKHNQWCLCHAKGKCNACIKRCPVGAISEEGHDKIKCKEYIRQVTALYVEQEQLGFKVNSCGLCQTKVPCEKINPTLRIKEEVRDK
jgi:epoxyqueuosine reductase